MLDPNKQLLNRTIDPEIKKILEHFASGIDQLIDFGCQIIAWDLEKKEGSDEDLPPILFLRNFLENIDSISILVRKSSINPCNNLLRTALENFLCVAYLLEKDTKQRSISFLVWNAFNNRKNLKKADGNSEEFKKLKSIYAKDKLLNGSDPLILPNVDEKLKNNMALLEMSKYRGVKDEYERTKKLLKKTPNWYSLFNGPSNLEVLALHLGYPAIYEILYRGLSHSVHGSDIIQGKISEDKENHAQINQIRIPMNAQHLTQHCFNIGIMLFNQYINVRLPIKENELKSWYLSMRGFTMMLSGKPLIVMN